MFLWWILSIFWCELVNLLILLINFSLSGCDKMAWHNYSPTVLFMSVATWELRRAISSWSMRKSWASVFCHEHPLQLLYWVATSVYQLYNTSALYTTGWQRPVLAAPWYVIKCQRIIRIVVTLLCSCRPREFINVYATNGMWCTCGG